MAFIETTALEDSTGDARVMLERQRKHYGYLPNYAGVFSDRPDIMDLWAQLQSGIRKHVDPRRFELITLAAALELRSSYCSLAHAEMLRDRFVTTDELHALANGDYSAFSEAEAEMMKLARQVVADSSAVTQADIERLRRCGLKEAEIFDVVAVATARCFFAKLVDGLGVRPDSVFQEMEEDLRQRLTVGRAIDQDWPRPTRAGYSECDWFDRGHAR